MIASIHWTGTRSCAWKIQTPRHSSEGIARTMDKTTNQASAWKGGSQFCLLYQVLVRLGC